MPLWGISANMGNHENRWPRLEPRDADRAPQTRCGGGTSRRKPNSGGGRAGRQPAQLIPLAGVVSAWWMGSPASRQAWWASTQAGWPCAAVDLQHADQQEPATTEVSVCAMDRSDGPEPDRRALQRAA